jgi:hypothetical protein
MKTFTFTDDQVHYIATALAQSDLHVATMKEQGVLAPDVCDRLRAKNEEIRQILLRKS